MEKEKVNTYLMMYKEQIPNEKILSLKKALEKADESCEDRLALLQLKNPIFMLLMSIFFGVFGVDRFLLGDTKLGVAKLLLGWLTLFIWPLIDIYYCYIKTKEQNFASIMQCLRH